MQEQIFISYRREGGDVTAKLICEALKNRGYTVFFDYDSLSGGYFDERIFEAIDGCGDFILVLPKNSMDRCVNEGDWVRQEIAHALKKGKNIVPVMLPDFTFPTVLPSDIENVKRVNGVPFVMTYFEGVMESIVNRLTEVPVGASPQNKGQGTTNKGAVPHSHSIIRNVCSFGSCDFDNIAPRDAYYSETISRDKYNVIYFSILTAAIKNKKSINTNITIYDSKNRVVHEDDTSIEWSPDYNKVVVSWIIKGKDGTFVKAGKYRAVFRIDDSDEFEYEFKVTVSGEKETVEKSDVVVDNASKDKWAARYLACPKLLLNCFITFLTFLIATTALSRRSIFFGLIFLVVAVISFVNFFKNTKKYMTNNTILALLLVTVGTGYYSVFLTIMSIANIFMAEKWRARI